MSSKILEITAQNALAAYNKADKAGKGLLINLFGEEVFNQKVTVRIKTFEDALDYSSLTMEQFEKEYGTSAHSQAYGKLVVITEALNEGWKPNWDENNYKYWPWFNLRSGFSFYDVGHHHGQSSIVGSRLCFKSRELAEYAAKQFLDLYKAFMTF